ncbi:MAG: hypothetical protein DWP98_08990 [Bacteroidetes bacterium]|nr:MAG: hypothetical protein DWP98_08990 [Bacteroidota bacterium]MBL1145990.1 hypothetical protein [Bacteroidota bacterium]
MFSKRRIIQYEQKQKMNLKQNTMKKLNIMLALFTASLCFTACEKEDANFVNNAELTAVKKEKVNVNKSEPMSFESLSELETYLKDLDPETSVKVKESSGSYTVISIPYNEDDFDIEASVWVIPDQLDEAWAEIYLFLSTGCWVDVTVGYGMAAVNLSC